MTGRIRVLVADDDNEVRAALSDIVRSDSGLELVGAAADAAEAVSLASAVQPDVAVVDVKMPDGGGPAATIGIRQSSPATRILCFSAYGDRDTVFELLRLGAHGFMVKGSSPAELLAGIHDVHAGRSALSPSVAKEVVGRLAHDLERDTQAEAERRRRLKHVKDAINGTLRIAFQPIVRLADRKVVGFEALARFGEPPFESPEPMFAAAAATGLTIELEVAAIQAALAAPRPIRDAYMTFNVSPETLFSGRLDALLGNATNLAVEITEHAPVSDYARLAEVLRPLKARGIRLAIDDTGAGFASLRHILLLEPEIIKLDRSLTSAIDGNPRQHALTVALASFARDISADVIAEGVENESELKSLKELGIEYGQGYLLGRPEVPAWTPV